MILRQSVGGTGGGDSPVLPSVLLGVLLLLSGSVEARSRAPVREFRRTHPCPATGVASATARCPGYVVDHIVPLCWGGADEPGNMAWQERGESLKKDRFERAACAQRCKR